MRGQGYGPIAPVPKLLFLLRLHVEGWLQATPQKAGAPGHSREQVVLRDWEAPLQARAPWTQAFKRPLSSAGSPFAQGNRCSPTAAPSLPLPEAVALGKPGVEVPDWKRRFPQTRGSRAAVEISADTCP